jgi:hypothetical protein
VTEQPQVRAALEKSRQVGCCVDQLLQVVDQKQELALAHVLGETIPYAQSLGDRLGDE